MTRTNAYTLLCVAIRAVALWSLISLLLTAAGQFVALRQTVGDSGLHLMAAALFAVALGVIALLWLFADKIARLALVRPQDATFESELEPAVWLGLAISAIGAWHLFGAVIDGSYWVVRWLSLRVLARDHIGVDTGGLDAEAMGQIVSTALQGVLGLICLLRGKGLAGWVHRMRYGAYTEAKPEA